jgi:hypothetical protein
MSVDPHGPQVEHGLCPGFRPSHPGVLHAILHQMPTGACDHPHPKRPAPCRVLVIGYIRAVSPIRAHRAPHGLPLAGRPHGSVGLRCQRAEHGIGLPGHAWLSREDSSVVPYAPHSRSRAGKESIVHFQNPWDALRYQAVEDAVTLFVQSAYAAATQGLEAALRQTSNTLLKRMLSSFDRLAEAYTAWDRFDHRAAYQPKGWDDQPVASKRAIMVRSSVHPRGRTGCYTHRSP